jgi:hypothetical protein
VVFKNNALPHEIGGHGGAILFPERILFSLRVSVRLLRGPIQLRFLRRKQAARSQELLFRLRIP